MPGIFTSRMTTSVRLGPPLSSLARASLPLKAVSTVNSRLARRLAMVSTKGTSSSTRRTEGLI